MKGKISLITIQGFEKALAFKDMFISGLLCTVILSALTVIFGFILALVLAIMRMSNIRPFGFLARKRDGSERSGFCKLLSKFNPVSTIASIYVEVIRATPLLVQLFIIFYVVLRDVRMPAFILFGNIPTDRLIPGVIALCLNSAAYLSEIIRSGISSIDLGQAEASRSLGMNKFMTMRYIILPQAIKNILPAIANEFVTIIKESSICYTIGVQELMYAVKSAQGAAFTIAEPLLIGAAIYFCLTFPTSKIIQYFERRMSRGDKR